MIQTKRVYDLPEPSDGARILVERRWPRGVRRETLQLRSWAKEVAPSDALRRWFDHDPAKWDEFLRRYFIELNAHPEAWQPVLAAMRRGNVTLLFSARDTEHNSARALAEFLERRRSIEAASARQPQTRDGASSVNIRRGAA